MTSWLGFDPLTDQQVGRLSPMSCSQPQAMRRAEELMKLWQVQVLGNELMKDETLMYLRGVCLKTASANACASSRGLAWPCWATRSQCLLRRTSSWWLAWGMFGDSRIPLSFSPHSSTVWFSGRKQKNLNYIFEQVNSKKTTNRGGPGFPKNCWIQGSVLL